MLKYVAPVQCVLELVCDEFRRVSIVDCVRILVYVNHV